jgi:hypothetical protein
MALKEKRKHITKKRGKKPGTRRQRGGLNHYALTSIDEYSKNRAHAVTNITIDEPEITRDIAASVPKGEDDLQQYIFSSSKLWKRNLKTQFAPVAQQKAIIPNMDNIGCSASMTTAVMRTIARSAPDRLCLFLPRDTQSITVLPAVNGDLNMFLRLMNSITILEKNIYIFSPPFFGLNDQTNIELFTQYLHYKTNHFDQVYLLIENNTNTIEAIKLVSTKAKENIGNTTTLVQTLTEDLAKYPTLPDKTIIDALYPMLEPSYIIYPYTVNFGEDVATSLAPKGGITQDEYDEKSQEIKGKLDEAREKADAAQRSFDALSAQNTQARANTQRLGEALTTASAKLGQVRQEKEALSARISADQGTLGTMPESVQKSELSARVESSKLELTSKGEAIVRAQAAHDAAEGEFKSASAGVQELESGVTKAGKAYERAKADSAAAGIFAAEEQAKLDKQKPEDSPAGSTEERGGLLFSAATTKEATLPAPVAGFNGAINYIQLSDQLKSVAYKINATKNDPLLESVDYKEYSLFKAPPMKKDHLYKMTLKMQKPETPIEVDVNQEMFKASPNAVQNHVPDVSISVGAQDFSIRSPVPDTVNDWKNGIYSNDEANYLQAMTLTPKMLITVYGGKWKEQLTNHLIIISRSKCFKDSRLLLHSDCQDAQRFVSDVINYYMTHSSELIALKKQQQEDQASKLSKQLKALTATTLGCRPETEFFDRSNFTQAFFLPEGADSNKILSSVGPIKVDTNAREYTVAYEGEIYKDEIQAICNELPDSPSLTIVPGKAGEYTWTFDSEQSRYMVKFISRKYLPKLKIIGSNYTPKTTSTITLIYTGKLSSKDENILKDGIPYESIEDGLLNMHTMKMDREITMDIDEIQALQLALDQINNINKFNITFTSIDINQIEGMDGTVGMNFGNSMLTLEVVFADRCNKDTLKAGELSMNYRVGVSLEEATDILEMKYADIYDKINDEKSNVFTGRYQLYTLPRSKLTKDSPPVAADT